MWTEMSAGHLDRYNPHELWGFDPILSPKRTASAEGSRTFRRQAREPHVASEKW